MRIRKFNEDLEKLDDDYPDYSITYNMGISSIYIYIRL